MTIIDKKTDAKKLLLAKGQEEWLTPQKVFEDYGFSTSTLSKWRMERRNLIFSKIGKYVRYKRSDIEAFLQCNKVEVM